jgi:translation initiation factor eIF-2B subunit epsilon
LIEYTLESLAIAEVAEILVVCSTGADKIKAYIEKSRWHRSTAPLVKVVVSQDLLSVGDALRVLDESKLLKSDFVLVTGDVVSNMNLDLAIKEHR